MLKKKKPGNHSCGKSAIVREMAEKQGFSVISISISSKVQEGLKK